MACGPETSERPEPLSHAIAPVHRPADRCGSPGAAEAAKKLAETSRLISDLKSSNLQQRRDALRKLSTTEPLPPETIQPLAEAHRAIRQVSFVFSIASCAVIRDALR